MASITYDRVTERYPDGTQAVCELDAAIRDGSRARCAVPPSALHFSDLSTGQAIAPRSPRLAAAAA